MGATQPPDICHGSMYMLVASGAPLLMVVPGVVVAFFSLLAVDIRERKKESVNATCCCNQSHHARIAFGMQHFLYLFTTLR